MVASADGPLRKDVFRHLSTLAMTCHQAADTDAVFDLACEKVDTLDCILLDLALAEKDGFAFLKRLRSDPEISVIPVIVILDRPVSDSEVLKLLEYGVVDHVTRPFSLPVLCAKVRAISERARSQRELRNRLKYALQNAAQDALTGLYNRRYFERRLREETAHARRHKRPFSLVMLDLDHFKLINDTYGHEDGDRVLRHVSDMLHEQLREDDVPCRFGGEEIVILLRDTSGLAACAVANRLKTVLATRPLPLGPKDELRHVTFSAGVAAADEWNTFDVDDIIGRADAALYRAKRAGRNRIEAEKLPR